MHEPVIDVGTRIAREKLGLNGSSLVREQEGHETSAGGRLEGRPSLYTQPSCEVRLWLLNVVALESPVPGVYVAPGVMLIDEDRLRYSRDCRRDRGAEGSPDRAARPGLSQARGRRDKLHTGRVQ